MRNSLTTLSVTVLLAACAHAPSQAGAFRLADVDEPPVLITCPEAPPEMPDDESMKRIAVRFDVDAAGRVVNAGPSGPVQPGWEDTTAEAVRMIRSCEYTPALKDGRPVEVAGMTQHVSTMRRYLNTRFTP